MWCLYSLGLVPLSLFLAYGLHASPSWVFASAVLAIVPLAEWTRRATGQLALARPRAGGLLNVTFGNLPEVVLGLFVLVAGHADSSRPRSPAPSSATGCSGWGWRSWRGRGRRSRQTFSRTRGPALQPPHPLRDRAARARRSSTTPSVEPSGRPRRRRGALSLGVSCVLIVVYLANLAYTLLTHRDVFGRPDEEPGEAGRWPVWLAAGVLCARHGGHRRRGRVGRRGRGGDGGPTRGLALLPRVIVLAVIGNAAEYFGAIAFAARGRMDLAVSISVGGSVQVALVVGTAARADLLLPGPADGPGLRQPARADRRRRRRVPVNAIAQDGEVTWFEGLLLLGVYAILALAFFYASP